MTTKFYFDFRDIFRAGRLGFRGKKMMIHFLGLILGYLIFEALTYLSLIGSGILGVFWSSCGLCPWFILKFFNKPELMMLSLPSVTKVLMGIGAFVWFIIFYIFNTAVAKVAIEELRGDDFYSWKDAVKFAGKRWKSIFVTMLALIFIFVFCLFWPSLVGLIDLIPKVEQAAEHFGTPLTAFFTIPVYFIGLFLVLLIFVFLFGLCLIPSIVATTGEDTFETIYQLFSTIWNQPWRLVIYDKIIIFVAFLGSIIFSILSFVGMLIAFLPSALLAKQESYYFADVIARSLKIIGFGSPENIVTNATIGNAMPWTLDLATFFMFASFIMIA
ncbi:hypothetical protein FJZ33_07970, partial [Candidatus Poribacteria bacterium]|nr:hypothetical protein [Candidatus Poribacteria bacterium]